MGANSFGQCHSSIVEDRPYNHCGFDGSPHGHRCDGRGEHQGDDEAHDHEFHGGPSECRRDPASSTSHPEHRASQVPFAFSLEKIRKVACEDSSLMTLPER